MAYSSVSMRAAVAALVVLAGLIWPGARLVAQTTDVVRDIVVEGSQRIEDATVRSYMLIVPGDPFDEGRIDRSLKALFATGLFADVTIRRQGNDLVVRVVENPIINRLAFEGNQRLSDEVLEKEVQLRPRQVYTRAKVQNDLQRILQLYRRSGRFAATVEPKVIQLPQNRVDLVFEINEGALTTVNRIRFIGNRKFSDSRLREAIATKESRWYRFLTSDDSYDPDRLTLDRELLRRYYLARGYADFQVLSAVAELTPSRDAFFITFTVEEGERYDFGEVDIRSEIEAVDTEAFAKLIAFEEGEIYDAEAVEKTIQDITFELGRQGYAFVDVRPEIERDRENGTIAVHFVINEGPRVYVERINITGNVRTLDRVVRREFRIVEGDAFNTAKLRRSRQRIRGLGFFDRVEITEERGSAPDRVIINAEVQEKSTGELSFGAGFSTTDNLIGDISIRERNLLGRGQDLRLGLSVSSRRQQIDLGFTEPYFLDREVAAGFDLFRRVSDFQDRSGYDQTSTGATLRGSYAITENLSQQLNYRIREDTIENLLPEVSQAIRDQEGTTRTSSVGHVLTYDRRDDRIDPTRGYVIRAAQDFAGPGGTEYFIRNTLSYTHYIPLSDQWIFSVGLEGGHIIGLDDDVSIVNRFFLGGESFRGFETGGVGPRDGPTNAALGGNTFYTGTLELSFPLGLPNEFGIMGRLFTVAGSLFEIDTTSSPDLEESSSVRVSVGFGVSWRSPFGPIRVDFGIPVVKEDFDEEELIHFNFGTRF